MEETSTELATVEDTETLPANLANITSVPHVYTLVQTDEEITNLVSQLADKKEIAFDTETTNIDANLADMVGMSFCWEEGEAYYVPVPEDKMLDTGTVQGGI